MTLTALNAHAERSSIETSPYVVEFGTHAVDGLGTQIVDKGEPRWLEGGVRKEGWRCQGRKEKKENRTQ